MLIFGELKLISLCAADLTNKNAYNSSCIQDISEMLASNRGFSGTGDPMVSVKFVMATKFETKSAITQFVYYEML